jgi:hypothetical protein
MEMMSFVYLIGKYRAKPYLPLENRDKSLQKTSIKGVKSTQTSKVQQRNIFLTWLAKNETNMKSKLILLGCLIGVSTLTFAQTSPGQSRLPQADTSTRKSGQGKEMKRKSQKNANTLYDTTQSRVPSNRMRDKSKGNRRQNRNSDTTSGQ